MRANRLHGLHILVTTNQRLTNLREELRLTDQNIWSTHPSFEHDTN